MSTFTYGLLHDDCYDDGGDVYDEMIHFDDFVVAAAFGYSFYSSCGGFETKF